MLSLTLTGDEVVAIGKIVAELSQRYETVEDAGFQLAARTFAEEMPRRVRRELNEFRTLENSGVLVVSGMPVDDGGLGATPGHWKDKPHASATIEHDIAFFLVGAMLGDPIGWATQQNGYIMHDVFPIKEHEHEQIGWGSDELLTWHTEDAFHPLRTDYLGLMCLRNPDGVETTYADVRDIRIDDETRKLLSEPRFQILPDISHRKQNQKQADSDGSDGGDGGGDNRVAELRRRSYDRVERLLNEPEAVPILFGAAEDPYICIDPYYMPEFEDEETTRVLATVCEAIDAAITGVVLKPGDMCFIDNYRVVHGRKPFRARFDGTDRWLRRLNVTRDLRKSREFRLSAESRVIY